MSLDAPQLAPSVAPPDDHNRQIGAQLPEFADGSSVYSYANLAPSLNDDPKAEGRWPLLARVIQNRIKPTTILHGQPRCL